MSKLQATEILLPLMGEGVHEATLVKWLKKVGDTVRKDEPLLEVSTDKVDTEIPSPAGGTLLEVLAHDGDTVQVNQVLARIGEAGATAVSAPATKAPTPPPRPAAAPVPQAAARAVPPPPVPTASKNEFLKRSSPLVRKMAKDQGIDLTKVPGSGLHGKINKNDLLNFIATPQSAAPTHSTTAAPHTAPQELLARLATTTHNGQEMLDGVPVRREKMSRMRRLIAEHMVQSVRTSPHVTTVFEIDLHSVVAVRESYRHKFEEREGFKLTFTPFLLHAAVLAIRQHPIVNVSVDGDDVLFKETINLGCAVALGNGLIVPVIKNAGELNLPGIARRLNDLVTRARSKKLTADDVQGGTFSVTNPGGFGSILSNPIINQPQVAILSIGAIVKRPVVIDDMIAIRPMMYAGLTFDHRVIDGEGGAQFLATYKNILEAYDYSPF